MSITLDMTWWKKTKPLTLKGELVTNALHDYEAAKEALRRDPTAARLMKVFEGIKALIKAFDKTKALCNATLHAACIKALNEAEVHAKKAYETVKAELTVFKSDLLAFENKRNHLAKVLMDLCKSRHMLQVDDAIPQVRLFLTFLKESVHEGKVSPDQMKAGIAHGTEILNLLESIDGPGDKAFAKVADEVKRLCGITVTQRPRAVTLCAAK